MIRAIALLLLATTVLADDVESELKRLTQENLDAIAPGHVEVYRRNLHEKFTHVDENGAVRNKAQLLAELTPLPKD